MRTIEEELAALAVMSAAQLRAEWQRNAKAPAPAISPDLMERCLAYDLQQRRYGGLSSSATRRLERLVRELDTFGRVQSTADNKLKPGTRLSRDWGGKTHHVEVLEDGFLFEEQHYGSLSQVAAAITGTAWSGPRFFGLKQRKGRVPERAAHA